MYLKNILVLLIALSFSEIVFAQKDAYKIFEKGGKETSYQKMLKELSSADVVFIGELHNNPIIHWLQLEITKDLFKVDSNLVLGAEMFEADNQIILNEYVAGLVTEANFKKEAKLWPNYATDYKPLLDFAKSKKLKFVATNIPRRYASIVFNKGFEGLNSLSVDAKKSIAPLPIEYDAELSGYKAMMDMGMHGGDNLPKAQAIKDATMGYFIAENLNKNKFIHYNGTYHSDDFQGILWYLNKYKPNKKIVTISCVEQDNVEKLNDESNNKGNFIIVIPSTMTKTH